MTSTEMSLVPKQQAGPMTEIAQSRQAQEVQAAVVMARRFPRDTTQALSRILDDCKREGLAERAVYSYPRGGQTVSGPSIRLAETIARSWGNIDCGVTELERKAQQGNLPGESTMQAYCWDLETNTRVTKIFTVKHWRDTRQGGHKLNDERDVYEAVANNGARRLRSCILAVIPTDIVEQAVKQCEKTMKGGQGPLIDRVRAMVIYFKDSFGVTQEMIEKKLGHKIDACSEFELVELKKIANSLKDNFADRSDFFDVSSAVNPQQTDVIPPNSNVQSIKNFAPQTSAEAATWEPGDFNEEIKEAPKPTRDEVGKQIVAEQKRLKMSKEKLTEICASSFSKTPAQLTVDEMIALHKALSEMAAT